MKYPSGLEPELRVRGDAGWFGARGERPLGEESAEGKRSRGRAFLEEEHSREWVPQAPAWPSSCCTSCPRLEVCRSSASSCCAVSWRGPGGFRSWLCGEGKVRACDLGRGGWGGRAGPGRAGQYLQVGDGGVQPVQPGPDHGAGIDATQLLPDGREESAGPLQVVQEQHHTVVTHCGQGAGGRGVRGGPEATRES